MAISIDGEMIAKPLQEQLDRAISASGMRAEYSAICKETDPAARAERFNRLLASSQELSLAWDGVCKAHAQAARTTRADKNPTALTVTDFRAMSNHERQRLYDNSPATYIALRDKAEATEHQPPAGLSYGAMSNMQRHWLAHNDPARFETERKQWLKDEAQ